MAKEYDFVGGDTGMLFDLRTFRARMIGYHMIDIKAAKDDKNYKEWFRAIELLQGIVHHLIKKTKNYEKDYQELRQDVVNVINKHQSVFLNNSNNSEGIFLIESALLELEMFLLDKMEEKGVFGKREDLRGL